MLAGDSTTQASVNKMFSLCLTEGYFMQTMWRDVGKWVLVIGKGLGTVVEEGCGICMYVCI